MLCELLMHFIVIIYERTRNRGPVQRNSTLAAFQHSKPPHLHPASQAKVQSLPEAGVSQTLAQVVFEIPAAPRV